MIVHVTPGGAVEVRNAEDLTRLHCEIAQTSGGLDAARVSLQKLAELPSPDVAWLSVDVLQSMTGLCNNDSWLQAFHAMIAKAGAYGWLNSDRSMVRAHVVWLHTE